MPEEIRTIYARSREEWRAWLSRNHEKENIVSLIKYKKHTGKPSLTSKEAMDEAICFGWIDTTIKRIDDERYMQRFVKRNRNSRWSNNTLSYARRLIKEKRMEPAGLKMYRMGLKKPTIDHNLPKNPDIPDDLKKKLEKRNALEFFTGLAPSHRRMYIIWVERAKRPDTRKKRIKEIVEKSRKNLKP